MNYDVSLLEESQKLNLLEFLKSDQYTDDEIILTFSEISSFFKYYVDILGFQRAHKAFKDAYKRGFVSVKM